MRRNHWRLGKSLDIIFSTGQNGYNFIENIFVLLRFFFFLPPNISSFTSFHMDHKQIWEYCYNAVEIEIRYYLNQANKACQYTQKKDLTLRNR